MSIGDLYEFHREHSPSTNVVPIATPVTGWRRFSFTPAQCGSIGGPNGLSAGPPPALWQRSDWGPLAPHLYSVGINYRWHEGILRARCIDPERDEHGEARISHTVPDFYCSCGFWAFEDPVLALRHGARSAAFAIGEVEMWGRLIRHEQGWRGEYARLKKMRICYAYSTEVPPTESFLDQLITNYPSVTILPPLVLKGPIPDMPFAPVRVMDPDTRWINRPLPLLPPDPFASMPMGHWQNIGVAMWKQHDMLSMQLLSEPLKRRRSPREKFALGALKTIAVAIALFAVFQTSAFAFHSELIPALCWGAITMLALALNIRLGKAR